MSEASKRTSERGDRESARERSKSNFKERDKAKRGALTTRGTQIIHILGQVEDAYSCTRFVLAHHSFRVDPA